MLFFVYVEITDNIVCRYVCHAVETLIISRQQRLGYAAFFVPAVINLTKFQHLYVTCPHWVRPNMINAIYSYRFTIKTIWAKL